MTVPLKLQIKEMIDRLSFGVTGKVLSSKNLAQSLQTMINAPGIKNIVPKWAEQLSQVRAFRVALINAYTTCAGHYYPKWSSYFYDEQFRAHGAAHLLASYRGNATRPEPSELANIWAEQITWLSEEAKQKHIDELVPVASRLLYCLEIELHDRHEFNPFFKGSQRKDQRPHFTRGTTSQKSQQLRTADTESRRVNYYR